ncbi:MAG: hypothetical protein QNJ94_09370 [Alphaproteobacteria bacterium]|nr:hypothetical protein [Alphaproteobacteria bacterium]
MKLVLAVFLAVVAASVVTFVRYESFSPCVWMEQDLAEQSGLPVLVVQSRIRAGFLIEGVVDPDPYDCVLAWWRFRAEGLPEES